MRILIDVSSIELFADDGVNTMTEIFFPNEDFYNVEVFKTDNNTKLKKGRIYSIKSQL